MAEEKLNLSKGDDSIPRVRMSEIGTTGLATSDGEVREQIKKELRWPKVITTYKNMYNDPLIYAALTLMSNMISKVDWDVKPPESASQEDIKKTKFIRQCMDDMEHSWSSFIKEVLSYTIYGFSVNEKVFRKRNKESGSKYEDNLIGWRKIAPRSQDTISEWKWSKDGRRLEGVYQDLSMVEDDNRFSFFFKSEDKEPEGLFIPRNKFMLFTYNSKRDNPQGESPLNACYVPWKFKTIIEEQEAIGVTRDLGGMPVLGLHPKYMSPDATDEDKAIYEYYKNVIRNIHNNEQSGLIYPLMYNDQGKKIIEFDLMSSAGGKQYDTNQIIKRYEDKILTALFSDILKLGQESHGSFSLAGAKTNIVAVNIEARLKEIADVLNNDLIPQTFKLNGWSDTELPKFVFEDLDQEDLDEFSKLVQRIGSVGFLPKDGKTVSSVMKRSSFEHHKDYENMSQEDLSEVLPEKESRAGESQGSSGTGDTQNGGAGSANNSENAA